MTAGINQFLDNIFTAGIHSALAGNLLTEADLDQESSKGDTLRVFIRLGWLDPATNETLTPASASADKDEPEPWLSEKHKAVRAACDAEIHCAA